jgi:nicotinate phosphoribosyltransferase
MTKYSAVYFNRSKRILNHENKQVTVQVFQKKNDTVLCGIDEATTMLKSQVVGADFKLRALSDGDIVQPWEPVMEMTGDLATFIEYESVYLGIMARGSRVATNASRVVNAANKKPVYFFGDRFDRFENQAADGWAAMIGGVSAVCTESMTSLMDPVTTRSVPAVGTMPHALIAAYDGSVVEACKAFHKRFPDVPLHALVDFDNDCVMDSLACLAEFGADLAGVRLDTSENMIDRSMADLFTYGINEVTGDWKPTGVNAQLVRAVRRSLDKEGGSHVKITVSGGFNAEKIAAFEAENVPVDIYAVGSSILSGNSIDFTADVVYPVAKAGRRLRDSFRLKTVVNRGI